ncbi:hypothetical protein FPV67DRAFT_115127 [Lyophyllum atratum]|nr:hypothetical protein FPV67DRAFT_115127 [Lyophyllum atratum]
MSVRSLVIDDTDPAVRYSGSGWSSAVAGSEDNFGTYGGTYNHTLHATNANDSLAFSFEGSSIRVFGTVDLAPTYGYSVVSGPDFHAPWECFVDNTSVGAVKPSLFHENNQLLCDADVLTEGAHELILKINMRNGTTFWVDYLQYTPSKVPNNTAVLLVEITDPAISYDSNWRAVDELANMTDTRGAQMRFNFTGTQLTWMGYIPIELPGNGSSASYSIDNGPPTSFSLNGHAPFDGTSVFNQAFFTTPELSNTLHTLAVTHNGDAGETPLTLDYIYLTVPSGGSSAGPAVVSGTPQLGSSSHSKPIGAIVGGVVGGLAAIAIAIFLLFFLRRRQNMSPSKWRFGRVSRDAIAVPFSPNQQPQSASSGENLSIDAAGAGFVSGAMAQVGDKKLVGKQGTSTDRAYLPSHSSAQGSRDPIVTTEVPPRYSEI